MTIEYETQTIIDAIRAIADGKQWDALEILRRETTDEGALNEIDMAQTIVEKPW